MANPRKTFSNVNRLDLPEATYTILYGMHIVEQNPDELPDDADFLLLETGMHEYLKDPNATVERLSGHVQYKALFEKAEKKNIPIVFADLKYKYNDFALLFLDNAASAAGWFAGTKLLKKSLAQSKERKYRQALLTGVIGSWMVMPFAINALRLGSSMLRVGEAETGKLKRFSHKVHPEAEVMYLTLRNAVIAEKAKSLARKQNHKPHIAIVLGAGHVGIEDMLTTPDEKRLAVFRRYSSVLSRFANPEYLYTTLISQKRGRSWQSEKALSPVLRAIL